MSTPTVKLIDITSDLSAHPTSADHESQFTGTGRGAVNARKPAAAGGESSGPYRGDVLQRIAQLAIAAPRRTIAIAALVMVAAGIFGIPVAKGLSAGGFEDPISESARATRMLTDKFGQGDVQLLIVVSSPHGFDGAVAHAVGTQIADQLRRSPHVASVTSAWTSPPAAAAKLVSKDGKSGLIVAGISGEENQALRDRQTAAQQVAAVQAVQSQMNAKKQAIDTKIDQVNSAAMKQAMAIFDQTGQYPDIPIPTANTVGGQALQAALSKRGDPYVWGAAGPGAFDCSGLVVWAYAQEGIALPHYTGDLWNSGVHIPRNDLEPGDLVFFFPDISHVGIYIGNGLMVDAPDFGLTVRVDPVYWNAYDGAVRIG